MKRLPSSRAKPSPTSATLRHAVAPPAATRIGLLLMMGEEPKSALRVRGERRGRSRITRSWYAAHAMPRSTKSLTTVFLDAPVTRQVAQIELPSPSARTTWVRRCALSLLILTTFHDRSAFFNKKGATKCRPLPRSRSLLGVLRLRKMTQSRF